MDDQERKNLVNDHSEGEFTGDYNHYEPDDYLEETSAEFVSPIPYERGVSHDGERERTSAGGVVGLSALILSFLSLFVLPIWFGGAGIVLGFIARRRGAEALGAWAIGIGAISIVIAMFIVPFFR